MACARESIPIPAHQRSQIRLLFFDRDRYTNGPDFQQSESGIRLAAFPPQEKRRFGEDWFAGEKWRAERFPLLDGPGMVLQSSGKKTQQGSRIEECGADTVMCVGEANLADLVDLCLDHNRLPNSSPVECANPAGGGRAGQ